MSKLRTETEIIKIILCNHPKWIERDNNREFGWNNCCICKSCNVGCGELLNDEKFRYLSEEDKEKIFMKAGK